METNQAVRTSDSFMEAMEKLRKFLTTADGSAFNLCAHIYDIIGETESNLQPILFKEAAILYENAESDESEDTPASPYELQEESLKEHYGQIVNSFIDFHTDQQYDTDKFYQNMWETIQNDVFFPNKAAKVFAFYYIMIDRRIPYFELQQGYQMTNSAFRELRKKHYEVLQKIRYISAIKIRQKTERASLILNELGIAIPQNDSPVETINAYEKQLIIMVEALQTLDARKSFFDHLLAQMDDDDE